MAWLIVIGIIAAVVFAIRSPQGICVLGRIWVVLSVLWIAIWYMSVAGHIGEPGYMSLQTATEWALVPPAVVVALFFVLEWIVHGAARRPGE
jgi:hypothetical protein